MSFKSIEISETFTLGLHKTSCTEPLLCYIFTLAPIFFFGCLGGTAQRCFRREPPKNVSWSVQLPPTLHQHGGKQKLIELLSFFFIIQCKHPKIPQHAPPMSQRGPLDLSNNIPNNPIH